MPCPYGRRPCPGDGRDYRSYRPVERARLCADCLLEGTGVTLPLREGVTLRGETHSPIVWSTSSEASPSDLPRPGSSLSIRVISVKTPKQSAATTAELPPRRYGRVPEMGSLRRETSTELCSVATVERLGDRGRLPPFSVAIRGSELRSVVSESSRKGKPLRRNAMGDSSSREMMGSYPILYRAST